MENHALNPKRLIGLAAIFLAQSLYFPINRAAQGGVELATPLDAAIPVLPIAAIPYLLSLVWWTGCFLWAAWKMDADLYRAMVVTLLAVMSISYAIYLLYPTYVRRPLVAGDDWQAQLMRFIYSTDRPYNAFPSGHAYTTTLIGLFWVRWRPRQLWLWIGIVVIVLLSTVLTRQHNLPDLIGGVALAWLGYRLGLWWITARPGR